MLSCLLQYEDVDTDSGRKKPPSLGSYAPMLGPAVDDGQGQHSANSANRSVQRDRLSLLIGNLHHGPDSSIGLSFSPPLLLRTLVA